MTKYYIETENGKTQRVDTENLIELYADGRWRGGRPIYMYMTKSKSRYFVENVTHWQGEHDTLTEVTREEMTHILVRALHPSRAAEGLALMGAEETIEEVV